jgi:hypothetical protein
VNDTQCFPSSTSTVVDGGCTWIYISNNEIYTNGKCIETSDESNSCDFINRMSQCADGGGITSLADKCGLYNNECKTLCSKIDENTCKNIRSSDCFWIEKNGTEYSGRCVDKV